MNASKCVLRIVLALAIAIVFGTVDAKAITGDWVDDPFIHESLHLIDCNDDFYSGGPCGSYVSRLDNVAVEAGNTYYEV